jgi:hypothetical protein
LARLAQWKCEPLSLSLSQRTAIQWLPAIPALKVELREKAAKQSVMIEAGYKTQDKANSHHRAIKGQLQGPYCHNHILSNELAG